MNRTLATAGAVLATSWMALGCNSASTPSGSNEASPETGKVALPLSSVSPTGAEYRLRNADFGVWGYPEDCWNYEDEGCEYTDETVSSEDYLDEPSIVLDLLRGSYDINLNSGWQLEKVVDGVGEPVEAVLLNSAYQYIWVQPYQTTWVTYQFGVGSEELWFTGQAGIRMEVYEDPEEYYGGDCYTYSDGEYCWEECCRETCEYDGCWGECSVEEVPCDVTDYPPEEGDGDGDSADPER